MANVNLEARFWSKVAVRKDDECWPWHASRNIYGYGSFWYNGTMAGAHCVAWTLTHGDPGENHVLHTCDNPPCVNPNHLYLGSHADNMRDMWGRGRRCISGERHPQVKLSRRDVAEIRQRIANGENYRLIAEDYPVGTGAIWMIATGRNWRQNDHRR